MIYLQPWHLSKIDESFFLIMMVARKIARLTSNLHFCQFGIPTNYIITSSTLSSTFSSLTSIHSSHYFIEKSLASQHGIHTSECLRRKNIEQYREYREKIRRKTTRGKIMVHALASMICLTECLLHILTSFIFIFIRTWIPQIYIQ